MEVNTVVIAFEAVVTDPWSKSVQAPDGRDTVFGPWRGNSGV